MLQIQNNTVFAADINICTDRTGRDTVIGVVKASFDFHRDHLRPSACQPPVIRSDEYWKEPGNSSIKYASEIGLIKPATDIVMNCHAVGPGEKPVTGIQIQLTVGSYGKKVHVQGDRFWKYKLGMYYKTQPQPFTRMPVIYENAFGGTALDSPKRTETRNPVGCGIKVKHPVAAARIPNVETSQNLIRRRSQRPEPAGFGYIAPHWTQRAQYAGTYDDRWKKERAPFLPDDFDARFFNAAHPDLITNGYIKGGEEVHIVNVSPDGPISCVLPVIIFEFEFHIAGQKKRVEPVMDTLLIEPDHNRLSLIWRGSTDCDKKALKVETLRINADSNDVTL